MDKNETDKNGSDLAVGSASAGSVWFAQLPKQLPQRQDSLSDQLHDLQRVATKLGMYDAADFLNSIQNTEVSQEGGTTEL